MRLHVSHRRTTKRLFKVSEPSHYSPTAKYVPSLSTSVTLKTNHFLSRESQALLGASIHVFAGFSEL